MFSYVTVGCINDRRRMLLCKTTELEKISKRRFVKIIKKAFPDIFTGFLGRLAKGISISISGCQGMYSSGFDCQVPLQEANNDWGQNPFIKLWVFEENGTERCGAEPVPI
jgi:hypothetical protein